MTNMILANVNINIASNSTIKYKIRNYLTKTSLQKVELMLTDVVHGTIKIQTFIF